MPLSFIREALARRKARRCAREYGEVEWSMGRTANTLAFFRVSDIKPSEFERRARAMWNAHHLLMIWEAAQDKTRTLTISFDGPGWTEFFDRWGPTVERIRSVTRGSLLKQLEQITGLPNGTVRGSRDYPTPEDYQALFREFVILAATK